MGSAICITCTNHDCIIKKNSHDKDVEKVFVKKTYHSVQKRAAIHFGRSTRSWTVFR